MEKNKCCENKLTYTRLKKREEKKSTKNLRDLAICLYTQVAIEKVSL